MPTKRELLEKKRELLLRRKQAVLNAQDGGVGENVAKGFGRGLTGIAGIQGDVGNLLETGARQIPGIGNFLGDVVSKTPLGLFPSSQDIRGVADAGVDALGGKEGSSIFEGGEDTLAGKTGEFIGGSLPFAAPGLARSLATQGIKSFGVGTRKFITSNVAAAAGSHVGGQQFGAVGEFAGALTPGAAMVASKGALRSWLRGAGKKAQADMQRNIAALDSQGARKSVGAASPKTGASAVERAIESSPGSHQVFMKAAEDNQVALTSKLESLIAKKVGSFIDEDAGIILKGAMKSQHEKLIAQNNRAFAKAEAAIPSSNIGVKVSVGNLKSRLKELAQGESDQYWNDLIQAVGLQDKTAGNLLAQFTQRIEIQPGVLGDLKVTAVRFDTLNNLRRAVGKKIITNRLHGDADQGVLKQIYKELAKASLEGAEKAGGPRARQLMERANALYVKNSDIIDDLIRPVLNKSNRPEAIYSAVIGAKGKNISTLKRTLRGMTPAQREEVTKTFVSNLGHIDDATGKVIPDLWQPGRFLRNWQTIDNSVKNQLFRGSELKKLRKSLDDFTDALSLQKNAAKVLANPSGTAGTGLAAATTFGAFSALSGLATFGLMGSAATGALGAVAGGIAGINMAARLFNNPQFINWLSRSTTIPAHKLPGHIARLAIMAQNETDPEMVQALDAYNSMLMTQQRRLAKEQDE